MKVETLLKVLALPLALLGVLVLFGCVYQIMGLPSSEELVALSRSYLNRYGYWIVFMAAFVETIPPVNFYLPGSAVVVLSAAHARSGGLNIFAVLAVVVLAFVFAYALDYAIGKFGWYRFLEKCGLKKSLENARRQLGRHGQKWLWLACIHPNTGALAATSCGVLNLTFSSFLTHAVLATILWVALWGAAAFYGGELVFALANVKWLIAAIGIWLVIKTILTLRKHNENQD